MHLCPRVTKSASLKSPRLPRLCLLCLLSLTAPHQCVQWRHRKWHLFVCYQLKDIVLVHYCELKNISSHWWQINAKNQFNSKGSHTFSWHCTWMILKYWNMFQLFYQVYFFRSQSLWLCTGLIMDWVAGFVFPPLKHLVILCFVDTTSRKRLILPPVNLLAVIRSLSHRAVSLL